MTVDALDLDIVMPGTTSDSSCQPGKGQVPAEMQQAYLSLSS